MPKKYICLDLNRRLSKCIGQFKFKYLLTNNKHRKKIAKTKKYIKKSKVNLKLHTKSIPVLAKTSRFTLE